MPLCCDALAMMKDIRCRFYRARGPVVARCARFNATIKNERLLSRQHRSTVKWVRAKGS